MTIKIGINGFGRIGRSIFRAATKDIHKEFEIVHINDLTQPETIAHLLKYDSVHGIFSAPCSATDKSIKVEDKEISISAIRSPAEIPWKEKNVDIVFECTGLFTGREAAEDHMKAGAPRVLISAPAKNEDITVVYGVNSDKLNRDHKIVSNGSCTTNCLAPFTKVVHEEFGIESGLMTTIHSYTNDQRILDVPHKDLRRTRAAAMNMIPTSTGAAKAIGLVLPELKGKIDGFAVRVPTPNVSLVDVTFSVKKSCSVEDVNQALQEAAGNQLKGVLSYTTAPLVSTDFNGNSHSSIIDGSLTKVTGRNLLKILSWYDNESGFSHRMLDVAKIMANYK